MSRRDEYLDSVRADVDGRDDFSVIHGRCEWKDVANAYDTGYQHGADDAGSLVAVLADMPGVDVVPPSSAPGYADAIADALRVLDVVLAARPYIRERTNALHGIRDRIAALAPAEPPPATDDLESLTTRQLADLVRLLRRENEKRVQECADLDSELVSAYALAEPPPLTERAREWADALVDTGAVWVVNPGRLRGADNTMVGYLATAIRDPDVLAALNEAARRLADGGGA